MAMHQGREMIHILLGLVANSISVHFLNLRGFMATSDVGFNTAVTHAVHQELWFLESLLAAK